MTTQQRSWFWILALAAFVAALYVLRPILLPFVAGMAVAYFLDPVCSRIQAWGVSRTLATALVTALFFVVVIVLVAFTAPLVYGQILEFVDRAPAYVEALRQRAGPWLEIVSGQVAEGLATDNGREVGQAASQYVGAALRWAASALGEVLGGLAAFANLVSLIVLTPIVAFYLLRDWDRIVRKVDGWLPCAHADVIRQQAREVDRILAGFVRGQATVCVTLGLGYGLGLTAVGLDFGFVVGLFTGFISFIPYFGMLIGFALGIGIAFAQFDSFLPILLVAAVFVAGQVIEGYFMTPKLVGGRVKLHEVWIIFALLAGGVLFGFVGVLLAVPIAAVVGVLSRFLIGQYLQSSLYMDRPHGEGGDAASHDNSPP